MQTQLQANIATQHIIGRLDVFGRLDIDCEMTDYQLIFCAGVTYIFGRHQKYIM